MQENADQNNSEYGHFLLKINALSFDGIFRILISIWGLTLWIPMTHSIGLVNLIVLSK